MKKSLLNINVHFNENELDMLGAHSARYGKRACLVMDPFFRDGSVEKRAVRLLGEKGIESVLFSDFRSDPDCTEVDKCVAVIKEQGCDFIVAIGGGSTIDLSKAAAVTAKNGGRCWEYCGHILPDGCRGVERSADNGKLPLIAVPTTSGTGSESDCGAVISNRELCVKSGIGSPYLFPEVAIVDPCLTLTLPPDQTAYTGFDAFSHAFESYMMSTTTALSEAVALQSIRYFGRAFVAAVRDGTDMRARSDMACASNLAGINLAITDTSVGHILGQPLSALFHMIHGATLAVTLDRIIDWIQPNAQDKLANVAAALRPELSILPESERASMLGDIVRRLKADAGIDMRLHAFGVTEADIPRILDYVEANVGMDCLLFAQYARVASRSDLEEILRASM